jgi:hypothetical protein
MPRPQEERQLKEILKHKSGCDRAFIAEALILNISLRRHSPAPFKGIK